MLPGILFLIVLLGICPYLIGLLSTRHIKKNGDSLALNFICGYIGLWGSFEFLALICLLFCTSLTFLTAAYAVLCLLTVIISLLANRERVVRILRSSFYQLTHRCPLFAVVLILVFFQVKFITTHQHIDDDDAFYVATAETAVTTDTLIEYDPYTGEAYDYIPARYVLSPFPVFVAVISMLTQIPTAALAHTFLPIFLIPLGYMVYYLLASVFWKKEEQAVYRALFTILLAIVVLFSGYSVYPQGTFFLFRIWQGKAVLAAILLPAVLYFGLNITRSLSLPKIIILLLLEAACCMVSSMGIMLGAILLGVIAIANLILYHKWKNVIWTFICCMPNIVLSAIYLCIR